MPFCQNCGEKFPKGEEKCPKCSFEIKTKKDPNDETGDKSENLPNKNTRRVWIVICALILLIAVFLILLFTIILPKEEAILKTPIGNFTYTQHYTNTYEEYSTKSSKIFLIFELTPVKGSKISKDDIQAQSLDYLQAVIDDETYTFNIYGEQYSDGLVTIVKFVFVVDKTNEEMGKVAELVSP